MKGFINEQLLQSGKENTSTVRWC